MEDEAAPPSEATRAPSSKEGSKRPSAAHLLQNRVLLDARALADLQQALTYFNEADRLWEALGNRPARHAIYKAGVITYSRPFIPARSPAGGQTPAYPVRELQSPKGFNREIHTHLLKLRNMFLAHTDPHAYSPRIGRAIFQFNFDTGEESRNELGLFTCIYSWDGTQDREYLHKTLRHIDIACKIIGPAIQKRLIELQALLAEDPLALGSPIATTWSGEQRIESGQVARYSARDLMGMTWKNPDADIGGPEYSYGLSNVFQSGADIQHNDDGVAAVRGGPAEIDFKSQ